MKNNILEKNKNRVSTVAMAGVFTAAIAIVSAYVKIPVMNGYIHAGDGLIYLAAAVMGPLAAIPAAIGSMLADILAGFPQYIIPTLIIKAIMGGISGLIFILLKRKKRGKAMIIFVRLAAIILGEAIMVMGYHISGEILYGKAAATGELIENICQALIGVVTGMIFVSVSKYLKKEKKQDETF